jgi:hypothetical protein
MFGYHADEFADRADWVERAYPFPEDRAEVERVWGKLLSDPVQVETEVEPVELRVLCQEGTS